MTRAIDDHFLRILSSPVFGHLATLQPRGDLQVNPMWFEFDPESTTVQFTHTTKRAKYRNLRADPRMTLSAIDPENPFKYVEVRGRLAEVIPDPEGSFYVRLGRRYGDPDTTVPDDKADRIVLVMHVEKIVGR
ncbi:PPOX class F420-dependent oxidoreductase [Agromyces neolithicus]|uniref:PPOX class F420-dependent oxidoreductase n=1 Tax=Agromyces neolithicus TaxID=269420 RepID=A0ABN2MB97_9MICO